MHPVVQTLTARSNSGPWARTLRRTATGTVYMVTAPVILSDSQIIEATVDAFRHGYRLTRVTSDEQFTTLAFRKSCRVTAKVMPPFRHREAEQARKDRRAAQVQDALALVLVALLALPLVLAVIHEFLRGL